MRLNFCENNEAIPYLLTRFQQHALFKKRDNLKLFDSIMTVKTSVGSLRSKRFQSSYWANVRTGAKKKIEGGRGGEKRK